MALMVELGSVLWGTECKAGSWLGMSLTSSEEVSFVTTQARAGAGFLDGTLLMLCGAHKAQVALQTAQK